MALNYFTVILRNCSIRARSDFVKQSSSSCVVPADLEPSDLGIGNFAEVFHQPAHILHTDVVAGKQRVRARVAELD